ncbi:arginase family protein [Spongiactinospora sp. TRM90649]|uniref:arginase family protein n=1 Tax=Spongiactinospora sp. TRM90649 TaxID=3031114 RepID=UPI0023F7ABEC|nr:arginase family protein [Spongiactinospora sp. TRM90649]MDF5758842.1 arginase family protein [Spongiactinospora sp. TRM90649]
MEGLLGMEVVEVSPPYDSSDVTSLLGVRLICDVLAASVKAGELGRTRGGEPQTARAREGRARWRVVFDAILAGALVVLLPGA